MVVMLAATLVFSNPIPSEQLNVGPAAYYAENYDHGGWDQIIAVHRAAGQLTDDFAPSPEGYYCAHPDLPLGTRVHVINAITGEEVTCVVADRVAPRDKTRWYGAVVIELSYRAYVAAGGNAFNRFVVYPEQ
jgi:rare lipoprotein A (peptidoglycan hydrolase)